VTAARCTGEPLSWLTLERLHLGELDAAARAAATAHLGACPTCRACLDELRADVVALPPLRVPAVAPRRRAWWPPLFAFAAAAAALVLWLGRPRRDAADVIVAHTSIKGLGEVVVGLVRERDGVIRDDVARARPGDRWKVVVTCAPGRAAWLDVAVVGDDGVASYPLAPTSLACGNHVVVPGAFTLSGARNAVCAVVGVAAPPRRGALGDALPGDRACVEVRAE
jgi:hypothetical protein